MQGSSVHLIMYNMTHIPAPNAAIVFGDGQQMEDVYLTCNILKNPKVFTVRLDSQLGSTQKTLSAMESITLKMNLTNSNNTAAATVEIGQTYTLHVSGAGTHFLLIKSCEAAGTRSMYQAVKIYDAATAGHSIGILANITNDTKNAVDTHPIMASLTGFRLVTSNIVFLSCQIEVCASPCSTSRKRKRIKSQLKTASIKFEVKDKLFERSANGAKGLFTTGKQIVTIAMVVVTTYLFH
ncbi:uncharacterized protein LOC110445057 isoform X2 [Mizuhopecten yessoensis]|uniref:uncharacterized protein LOC110445057 isoform X2 n=1 Tax=Mizuhopecten yessoensis TaxID=6573 RepID=UPI000B459B5D|nr:uncharacterized protein LOC110445057 isoform X2 [Mizuhopecten yessoensis]